MNTSNIKTIIAAVTALLFLTSCASSTGSVDNVATYDKTYTGSGNEVTIKVEITENESGCEQEITVRKRWGLSGNYSYIPRKVVLYDRKCYDGVASDRVHFRYPIDKQKTDWQWFIQTVQHLYDKTVPIKDLRW